MVVHPPDAALADATVMGARRPVRLAARAHRPLIGIRVGVRPSAAVVQIGEVEAALRQRHGARI